MVLRNMEKNNAIQKAAIIGASLSETHIQTFAMYIHVTRAAIYILYAVRDLFQHLLRGRMKELRVTCKGRAGGSILHVVRP